MVGSPTGETCDCLVPRTRVRVLLRTRPGRSLRDQGSTALDPSPYGCALHGTAIGRAISWGEP